MCKFIVVLFRRQDFSRVRFLAYLRDVHGPMAEALPRIAKYVQNHVAEDPSRRDPGWDAVVELWWPDRRTMEEAWQSPEGKAATADLAEFADLDRTSWSIVDEWSRT